MRKKYAKGLAGESTELPLNLAIHAKPAANFFTVGNYPGQLFHRLRLLAVFSLGSVRTRGIDIADFKNKRRAVRILLKRRIDDENRTELSL